MSVIEAGCEVTLLRRLVGPIKAEVKDFLAE